MDITMDMDQISIESEEEKSCSTHSGTMEVITNNNNENNKNNIKLLHQFMQNETHLIIH